MRKQIPRMDSLYNIVKSFLNRFKAKAKSFGIRFRIDRNKNFTALDELGINAEERKQVVMNLEPEDYYRGPHPNTLNNDGDLWEFGKKIKRKTAYIKLSEGETDSSPVCVSFHPAEKTITYPLKTKGKSKKGGEEK